VHLDPVDESYRLVRKQNPRLADHHEHDLNVSFNLVQDLDIHDYALRFIAYLNYKDDCDVSAEVLNTLFPLFHS
jgi:hypothetical protein